MTTTVAPSTPGNHRRDGLFMVLVALVGCAVAIVDTFSVVHDRAEAGRPLSVWEPLLWETSSCVVLVGLAPAIMTLARWATPLHAPWRRVIPVQLAGAFVFSLVHVAAMGVIRWAAYASVGGEYPALSPLLDFPYELRKDVLTYVAITAIYVGWLRIGRPSGSASREAAIEVRDGARRRFVSMADIVWIEAAGNYVELHRDQSPVLHRASLGEMERQLKDAGFVRIHRSRLVRRDAVTEVESKPSGDFVVRLEGGRELSGSRRYRRPLLEP